MRTVATAAALAFTLCVGACAGPKEQEFTRNDADAVRKASTELTTAFNAKDVNAVVALYAGNSVFMPPNSPLLRGPEPLKSYYDDLISKKGATGLRLDVEQVSGYGPLAYESGSYSVDFEGTAPGHDRGKYLRVLRNMNGTWRVEYTIWSSDLPPAANTHADD